MNSDVLNPEFEVLVGDKTFKVKQLSLGTIFSIIEKYVKTQKITDAKEFADQLPPSERQSFLLKAWNSLPKGADLHDLTTEIIQTPAGVCLILKHAILKFNKIKEEELDTLIEEQLTINTIEDYTNMVFRILGLNESNTSSPDDKDVKSNKKKST